MTDTINGRTPEEIKKGLECCNTIYGCKQCPYDAGDEDLSCCVDCCYELAKRVESAQPKWISVEERLPDDLEEVLILVKETEFYGQYKEFSKSYFCQYIGCVDDGEWFTVWCHGHRYIKDTAKEPYADKFDVTHWMPLPEPPKEET